MGEIFQSLQPYRLKIGLLATALVEAFLIPWLWQLWQREKKAER